MRHRERYCDDLNVMSIYEPSISIALRSINFQITGAGRLKHVETSTNQ